MIRSTTSGGYRSASAARSASACGVPSTVLADGLNVWPPLHATKNATIPNVAKNLFESGPVIANTPQEGGAGLVAPESQSYHGPRFGEPGASLPPGPRS